jgi:mono/diheme cytochrome c family protein
VDDLVDDPNYKARCKVCHGANADGPSSIENPPLKTRADRSEAELAKAIEEGNPTTTPKMPPFKEKLTPDDIETLVQEIKALK